MSKKNLQLSKLEKYEGKFHEPKVVTNRKYYAIVEVTGNKESKQYVVDVEGQFPLQARNQANDEAKLMGGQVIGLYAYNN
jgi:hypothetical protein